FLLALPLCQSFRRLPPPVSPLFPYTSLFRSPQQNVMVSLFVPCEMLHLQGLHPYSCEGFSSYLSGSMAEQPFLRQAEDTGIPNRDRKSTRLNSSHVSISYAVFCLTNKTMNKH